MTVVFNFLVTFCLILQGDAGPNGPRGMQGPKVIYCTYFFAIIEDPWKMQTMELDLKTLGYVSFHYAIQPSTFLIQPV